MTLQLDRLDGRFAVVRLAPDAGMPHWAMWSRGFLSISRCATETTVICEERLLPEGMSAERDFVAFAVRGPLDFSVVGMLARLTAPLAAADIPLLAVSTFDTDVLFVRASRSSDAVAAWSAAAIEVVATGAHKPS